MAERHADTIWQPRECQWIDGDPVDGSGAKCRKPVLPGSPYCREHHELAYVRKKSKPQDLVSGSS